MKKCSLYEYDKAANEFVKINTDSLNNLPIRHMLYILDSNIITANIRSSSEIEVARLDLTDLSVKYNKILRVK